MNPERLAEIRERATCPSATQAVQIGECEACARTLVEHDVPDLLAEVKRLSAENARMRAGIEEIADEAEDAWNTTGWWAARRLRALLNPTEGGGHE